MRAPATNFLPYLRSFLRYDVSRLHNVSNVLDLLENVQRDIATMTPLKTEEDLSKLLVSSIRTTIESLPAGDLGADELAAASATLEGVKTDAAPKTSSIVPRHRQAADDIKSLHVEVS